MTPCATCHQPFAPKSTRNRFCTRDCQEEARRVPIPPRLAVTLNDESPRQCAEGQGVRRIWCRRQSTCIAYAEGQRWEGFDCGTCPVDDELTMDERRAIATRSCRTEGAGARMVAAASDACVGVGALEHVRAVFRGRGWK